MDNETGSPQRIARLTALADVLACIDARVAPIEAREVDIALAVGRTLAADVAGIQHPRQPLALRDGFAVRSELTTDASAYAPVSLQEAPRIDVGIPLPAGADAVAPLETVVVRDGRAEITAPLAAGDGVLPAGGDADEGTILLRQGTRLTCMQAAVLAATQVPRVAVREPRVRLAAARAGDAVIDAALGLIAGRIAAAGGCILPGAADDAPLAGRDADAIFVIGGTGSGINDASVRKLAAQGEVVVHGIAISPGETAAFGFVGRRPVLLIPGRLDAAIAAWLLLGQPMFGRLSGCTQEPPVAKTRLSRKVASALGLTELVPVRLRDGIAEPIASGYLPLAALAQADGWILIAPESEGYPSGAEVMVRAWP